MESNKPITDFTPMQLDALREIGNIGAGNAATAFAQFLNKKMDMTVPQVKVVELSEVPELFGGAEVPVAGITLRVLGEAPGHMLFLLEKESACKLIEIMGMGESDGMFSEMEISALKEIVNILSGSYLSALNQVTNFTMVQSVPAFAMDMAGAILGAFMVEFGRLGDHAILIETEFFADDEEIRGNLFFIPGQNSLNSIFSAIGLGEV